MSSSRETKNDAAILIAKRKVLGTELQYTEQVAYDAERGIHFIFSI